MAWPQIEDGVLQIPMGSWGNGIPLGFIAIVVAAIVGLIALMLAVMSKRREENP